MNWNERRPAGKGHIVLTGIIRVGRVADSKVTVVLAMEITLVTDADVEWASVAAILLLGLGGCCNMGAGR